MRTPLRPLLLALSVLPLSSFAAPVPIALTHQGYMLDAGDQPVSQNGISLSFSLWSSVSASEARFKVWPITGAATCTADVRAGYYAVTLGGTEPGACGANLTSDAFPIGEGRYLEVSVAGTVLSPRLHVGSVPIAALASNALDAEALQGAARAAFWEKASDLSTAKVAGGTLAEALAAAPRLAAENTFSGANTFTSGVNLRGAVTFGEGLTAARVEGGVFTGDGGGLTNVRDTALRTDLAAAGPALVDWSRLANVPSAVTADQVGFTTATGGLTGSGSSVSIGDGGVTAARLEGGAAATPGQFLTKGAGALAWKTLGAGAGLTFDGTTFALSQSPASLATVSNNLLNATSGGLFGVGTASPIDRLQVAPLTTSPAGLGEMGSVSLVFNGSAELDGSGWTPLDFGVDASTGSGSVSSSAPFSGTKSFLMSNDGGWKQAVTLVPDAVYTLSLRMRTYHVNNPGDGAVGYLVVQTAGIARDLADTACRPNNFDQTPTLNQWSFCAVTFQAPANADQKTVALEVGFRAAGSTHTIYVDDVSLVKGGLARGYSSVSYRSETGHTAVAGSLGVGTQTPESRLHVDGSLSTRGLRIADANVVTVNAGATVALPGEGYFFIYQHGSPSNLYASGVRAGNGPTVIFNQAGFTTAANTPSKLNIYDGGSANSFSLMLQNTTATAYTFRWVILGAPISP